MSNWVLSLIAASAFVILLAALFHYASGRLRSALFSIQSVFTSHLVATREVRDEIQLLRISNAARPPRKDWAVVEFYFTDVSGVRRSVGVAADLSKANGYTEVRYNVREHMRGVFIKLVSSDPSLAFYNVMFGNLHLSKGVVTSSTSIHTDQSFAPGDMVTVQVASVLDILKLDPNAAGGM